MDDQSPDLLHVGKSDVLPRLAAVGRLEDAVTDAEILAAYRFLAAEESVYCEPASAASVAGLLKVGAAAGSTVVCVLTGNGLKDPDTAVGQISPPPAIAADYAAIVEHLGL